MSRKPAQGPSTNEIKLRGEVDQLRRELKKLKAAGGGATAADATVADPTVAEGLKLQIAELTQARRTASARRSSTRCSTPSDRSTPPSTSTRSSIASPRPSARASTSA